MSGNVDSYNFLSFRIKKQNKIKKNVYEWNNGIQLSDLVEIS